MDSSPHPAPQRTPHITIWSLVGWSSCAAVDPHWLYYVSWWLLWFQQIHAICCIVCLPLAVEAVEDVVDSHEEHCRWWWVSLFCRTSSGSTNSHQNASKKVHPCMQGHRRWSSWDKNAQVIIVVLVLCCQLCVYVYDTASSMVKMFCNWFRLPYPSFLQLVDQIKSDDRFERWCGFK